MVLDIKAEAVAVAFEFGADDGFDASFGGSFGEFHGAVQVVFVG